MTTRRRKRKAHTIKRARATVERSPLDDALAQMPAGICVTRGRHHIVEIANLAYRRLVGNRDVIGKPFREALPDADPVHLAVMDRVYESGEPYNGPAMTAPVPGESAGRFFNVTYQPLRDTAGCVYGVTMHAVDVTELVASREALEGRTAELARLAFALERSNRELDAFAYAASHDLRAPLRGIANLAQWIEEDLQGTLKEETKEMLQLMRGRMLRMEALIEGILQYSRAGRTRTAPETVNVTSLLQEVVDLLAPRGSASVFLPDQLPEIVTERLPLQQVFMNLISNALKYAGPHARVEVGVRDLGEVYEFSVADNGPGIAPEFHDRIWGIFQTLESRDTVEAAGVGLALVKKLVEGQGGRVWIESESGKGATFRFLWRKEP